MKPRVVESDGVRILCISEVRGALSQVQAIMKFKKVHAVIHVGSFGFFDGESALSMPAELLAQVANSSRVVRGDEFHQMDEQQLRESVGSQLSELSLFIAGVKRFVVPVYVVYGGCEDIRVVEKFRDGSYNVPNLHLVDETNLPVIRGTRLRLLGLPGLFDESKLLDIGSGTTNVAGDGVSMWSTMWQLGELCHQVKNSFNPQEIRVFCTHSPAASAPLLQHIAMLLRADFYIGGGMHYAYPSSFSMKSTGVEYFHFEKRLQHARDDFSKMWSRVEPIVRKLGQPRQRELIESTVALLTAPPSPLLRQHMKRAFNSMWFLGLCGIDCGTMLLKYSSKHTISLAANSAGFDFSPRAGEVNANESNDASESSEVKETADTSETAAVHSENTENTENVALDHDHSEKEQTPAKLEETDEASKVDGSSPTPSPAPSAPSAPSTTVVSPPPGPSGNPVPSGPAGPTSTEPSSTVPSAPASDTLSKKAKKKERIREREANFSPYGLWFKNGDRPIEEILACLNEEDRALNPKVVVKPTFRPGGGKTKVVLVFFATAEQASQAYDRVNKDEAGTVSIYQPDQHRPKPFRRNGPPKLRLH